MNFDKNLIWYQKKITIPRFFKVLWNLKCFEIYYVQKIVFFYSKMQVNNIYFRHFRKPIIVTIIFFYIYFFIADLIWIRCLIYKNNYCIPWSEIVTYSDNSRTLMEKSGLLQCNKAHLIIWLSYWMRCRSGIAQNWIYWTIHHMRNFT